MKQKLKNYLKFGTFLFGIILVVLACEKETINTSGEIYQEKRLKRISLETLNSRISNRPDYSNLSSLFDVNKVNNPQNHQRLESTDEAWLMTDEIVMIERENATFYTFKIGTNATGEEFYNLIVAMDETGTIVSMRILEYIPSDSWLNDTSQPFVGGVKLIENTFFTTSDVTNTLSARGSSECVTGLDYEWVCNAGNNHAPNTCTAGGSEIIITPVYGPCPEIIDAGDSSTGGGFPVDTGSTGGGNTPDNDDGDPNDGDPPTDGENCILDSDGNCLQDDTTPLIPPRETVDDKNCNELQKLFQQPNYAISPPFKSPKVAISDLQGQLNANGERGYNLVHNSSLNALASQVANPTSVSVMYRFTANNYGGMHTHPDDNKGFPMFSAQDIIQLLQFKNAYNNGIVVDPSLFVHVLVSAQGTYAIKINDASKLQQLQAIIDDYDDANGDGKYEFKEFVNRLGNRLQQYQDRFTEFPNGSPSQYQREFLKFLNNFDGNGNSLGVSLYKADNGLTTWSKLTLNESTNIITATPCN